MNPIVTVDRGGYRKYGYELKSKNLFHNGHDYNVDAGSYVLSVAEGKIIYSDEVDGFGSLNPRSPGGVIITEHDIFGLQFTILHGHIRRFHPIGLKVTRGYALGIVSRFTNDGIYLPHLHYAIHKGLGIPNTKWGYVKQAELAEWYNPLEFLEVINAKYRENSSTV